MSSNKIEIAPEFEVKSTDEMAKIINSLGDWNESKSDNGYDSCELFSRTGKSF